MVRTGRRGSVKRRGDPKWGLNRPEPAEAEVPEAGLDPGGGGGHGTPPPGGLVEDPADDEVVVPAKKKKVTKKKAKKRTSK